MPLGGGLGQSVRAPVLAGQAAPSCGDDPQTRLMPSTPDLAFLLAYREATLGVQVPVAQLLASANAAESAPFCSSARFWYSCPTSITSAPMPSSTPELSS